MSYCREIILFTFHSSCLTLDGILLPSILMLLMILFFRMPIITELIQADAVV